MNSHVNGSRGLIVLAADIWAIVKDAAAGARMEEEFSTRLKLRALTCSQGHELSRSCCPFRVIRRNSSPAVISRS